MKFIIKITIFIILLATCHQSIAQETGSKDKLLVQAVIENGDTIPILYLPVVYIFPPLRFKNQREENFYWKTVRDVKKTLPYAKMVSDTMAETDKHLQTLSEKEKKQFLKQYEKDLFKQYEGDLKKMTISQGRMLIRLIDRECDRNAYQIIQMYRGGFTAFCWQGVARILGANLKSEYDPDNNDKIVERVIILVENGQL